jgi:DNA repair protein RecN (Recombination protein N)
MLKHLHIQNIILVENAHVPFNAGFNVISGETGSGKSAIMDGLSLVIGERADTSIIRRGCEKGAVEAIFDIDQIKPICSLLAEAGIDHEIGQELIIRREIYSNGKSRAFINNQLAQITLLKKLGSYLVQIVGQHANQGLFSLDYHRDVLDLYGVLKPSVELFKQSFEMENAMRQELNALVQSEAQRLREIDLCQMELEELEEAALKEGEDEELFAEYTLLVNGEEIAQKVRDITQALSGERQSLIAALNRQKANLESLTQLDPHLEETASAFNNSLLEIQEVSHTLTRYQSRLHHDHERLAFVNERLTLINKLKRKYGSLVTEIQEYQKQLKERLKKLENADTQIEELQIQLAQAEAHTNQLAQTLTEKRCQTAQRLQVNLTQQLRSLNMPKAEFIVRASSQKRNATGDDRIEFFLVPNIGEHEIALKEGASGGEISRVMLALQTLLAGKEQTPTLIFDEVDANIGGETASIVGDKLTEIAAQHQIVCITHFPQVASQAHHHLQISKQEKEGRTVTLVRVLDAQSRQEELARMMGGKATKETALFSLEQIA